MYTEASWKEFRTTTNTTPQAQLRTKRQTAPSEKHTLQTPHTHTRAASQRDRGQPTGESAWNMSSPHTVFWVCDLNTDEDTCEFNRAGGRGGQGKRCVVTWLWRLVYPCSYRLSMLAVLSRINHKSVLGTFVDIVEVMCWINVAMFACTNIWNCNLWRTSVLSTANWKKYRYS